MAQTDTEPMTSETGREPWAQAQAKQAIERFVQHVERQDLAAVAALYTSDAVWEIHVPGWDTQTSDRTEMRQLHERFFGRDAFRVEGYQLLQEGNAVALRWDLTWRDRQDGALCVSFQSHFFEVAGDRIRCHRMYCAGVRVDG